MEDYILIGDSAGGNLSLCLTYWLIESKKKLPIFLGLFYPVMYMRINSFTPSMFILLEDLLLNYGSMEIIVNSYLENKQDCYDPFVSPSLMKDDILKLMPNFCIYVGSDDPLYDDSVRFVHRLSVLKRSEEHTLNSSHAA